MYRLECRKGDEIIMVDSEIIPNVGADFRLSGKNYKVFKVENNSSSDKIVVELDDPSEVLRRHYSELVSKGEAKPIIFVNGIRKPSAEMDVSISVEKNKKVRERGKLDKLVELKKELYHELLMSDYKAMSTIERALMSELSNDEDVRKYYDSMGV